MFKMMSLGILDYFLSLGALRLFPLGGCMRNGNPSLFCLAMGVPSSKTYHVEHETTILTIDTDGIVSSVFLYAIYFLPI